MSASGPSIPAVRGRNGRQGDAAEERRDVRCWHTLRT